MVCKALESGVQIHGTYSKTDPMKDRPNQSSAESQCAQPSAESQAGHSAKSQAIQSCTDNQAVDFSRKSLAGQALFESNDVAEILKEVRLLRRSQEEFQNWVRDQITRFMNSKAVSMKDQKDDSNQGESSVQERQVGLTKNEVRTEVAEAVPQHTVQEEAGAAAPAELTADTSNTDVMTVATAAAAASQENAKHEADRATKTDLKADTTNAEVKADVTSAVPQGIAQHETSEATGGEFEADITSDDVKTDVKVAEQEKNVDIQKEAGGTTKADLKSDTTNADVKESKSPRLRSISSEWVENITSTLAPVDKQEQSASQGTSRAVSEFSPKAPCIPYFNPFTVAALDARQRRQRNGGIAPKETQGIMCTSATVDAVEQSSTTATLETLPKSPHDASDLHLLNRSIRELSERCTRRSVSASYKQAI